MGMPASIYRFKWSNRSTFRLTKIAKIIPQGGKFFEFWEFQYLKASTYAVFYADSHGPNEKVTGLKKRGVMTEKRIFTKFPKNRFFPKNQKNRKNRFFGQILKPKTKGIPRSAAPGREAGRWCHEMRRWQRCTMSSRRRWQRRNGASEDHNPTGSGDPDPGTASIFA